MRTEGLEPPKNQLGPRHYGAALHWLPSAAGASPSTYLGVKVDETRSGDHAGWAAQQPICFASGEIMAGSILGKGYLAGFGMSIGTVFRAGSRGMEAAKRVRN